MKRFLAALWAVLLLLSLSACKGKEPLPPESSAPPASAPVETPPPEEPDPQPDPVPLPDLQPGKILALGDQRLGFAGGPGDDQLATQAELDRWNDLIATAPVVRMDFNDMHQEEKDLSVEQEQEILDALRGAALELYPPDHRENPVTGGGYTVVAYDGEENVLFKAIYIGNWFTVQFGTEKARYIFDGEGTTLNDIYARGW